MNPQDTNINVAIVCDLDGYILHCVNCDLCDAAKPFSCKSLIDLVSERDREKAINLFTTLRIHGTVFNSSMVFPCLRPRPALYCSGFVTGQKILIIISSLPFKIMKYFQDYLGLDLNRQNELQKLMECSLQETTINTPKLSPLDTEVNRLTQEILTLRNELDQQNIELHEEWQWFSVTLSSIADGVIATDEKGLVKFINPVAENISGWDSKSAMGKSLIDIFTIEGQLSAPLAQILQQVMTVGELVHFGPNTKLTSQNGWNIPIDGMLGPIRNEERKILGSVVVFRDITERIIMEKELRDSKSFTQQILDTNPNIIYIHDLLEHRNNYSNREVYATLGYSPEEIKNMTYLKLMDLFHPDDIPMIKNKPALYENMNDGDIKEFEMRVRDIDGNYHCFICRETIFRRTPDNKPHLILGTAQDITERKQAEDRIRELAIRDGLTGLYNHRQFYELLAAEMDRCKRYNRSFCLILGDLDKFKNINDQYGHVAGDEVLRALSGFFMDHIRASDMVARYGGEEFAIIMPETPKEKAFEVADRLRDLISQCPIPISNDVDITVTISFGIACFNDLKKTDLDIFSAADKALYEAKANGRNRVCIY